jgi:tetratricopeptide (TPR) repeat protein
MSALAWLAERVLRLVERPPLITALGARGSVITIHSYLVSERALASWNGEDLHLYIVATLALVLAVAGGGLAARALLAGLAFVLAALGCLAITVVQLEATAQAAAATLWQIRLYTDNEMAWIERFNDVLIGAGMLLFPAFLFLVAYLRRLTPRSDRGGRPRKAWVVASLIVAAAAGAYLASGGKAGEQDEREGWQKILRLNSEFVPALINVGLQREAQGQLDAAIELYRHALQNAPDLVAGHYNLGHALQTQGRTADAVRSYEEALRRDENHAASRRNLAAIRPAILNDP